MAWNSMARHDQATSAIGAHSGFSHTHLFCVRTSEYGFLILLTVTLNLTKYECVVPQIDRQVLGFRKSSA
jgi:hypothetical protein